MTKPRTKYAFDQDETPLEEIFGTSTRALLLATLAANPDQRLSTKDLVEATDRSVASVGDHMRALSKTDLVDRESVGPAFLFRINTDHPAAKPLTTFFEELQGDA